MLPKEKGGVNFAGNESIVIFISNDQKVSLPRIISLFYQRILNRIYHSISKNKTEVQNEAEDVEIESLLKECLSRLWIARCKDSLQFKATLATLSRRIATIHRRNQGVESTEADANSSTSARPTVTLIIDCLDAFKFSESKGVSQESVRRLPWRSVA